MDIPVHPLLLLIPAKPPLCITRKVLLEGFRIYELNRHLEHADEQLQAAMAEGCDDCTLKAARHRAATIQQFLVISLRTTWH